jgi:hypothetical protein
MHRLVALLVVAVTLAGCSGSKGGGSDPTGDLVLQVQDSLANGRMELGGAYVRGSGGWAQLLDNGTAFAFKGQGNNLSAAGEVPAGDYDRLRLVFKSVASGERPAILTQSGIEVAANITVTDGGNTSISLGFAWADSFFQSADGLAFTPILSRLVVIVDGSETMRLEASQISTGSGKAPVARMRVFDATGLEAFASTFVADSPENPIVANAGNITLVATGSEVLQPGTSLTKTSWDIEGLELIGNTVKWAAPIDGGNFTVRLTVEDSDGNKDTQTITLALKPGIATRSVTFTGEATGAGGCPQNSCTAASGVEEHVFSVDNSTFDNASATLTHVLLVLSPGSATVPVSDLDVTLDDGAAKRIGSQTGAGSQHKIDVDVTNAASGDWKVQVIPDPGAGASYTVTVTLTWKGINPGMEAFLASYDDGHSHEH